MNLYVHVYKRSVVGQGSKVWKAVHKILPIVERAYCEFDRRPLEKDFTVNNLVCSIVKPICLCVFLLHLVPRLVESGGNI